MKWVEIWPRCRARIYSEAESTSLRYSYSRNDSVDGSTSLSWYPTSCNDGVRAQRQFHFNELLFVGPEIRRYRSMGTSGSETDSDSLLILGRKFLVSFLQKLERVMMMLPSYGYIVDMARKIPSVW